VHPSDTLSKIVSSRFLCNALKSAVNLIRKFLYKMWSKLLRGAFVQCC